VNALSLPPTFVGWLVRALGWSPIGKTVEFVIEEGEDPLLVGKHLIGAITALKDEGSATVKTSAGEVFTLLPRHVGFGFYYLRIGKIAAYLLSDSQKLSNGDSRSAEGILALR
jgi:hypothetical protein